MLRSHLWTHAFQIVAILLCGHRVQAGSLDDFSVFLPGETTASAAAAWLGREVEVRDGNAQKTSRKAFAPKCFEPRSVTGDVRSMLDAQASLEVEVGRVFNECSVKLSGKQRNVASHQLTFLQAIDDSNSVFEEATRCKDIIKWAGRIMVAVYRVRISFENSGDSELSAILNCVSEKFSGEVKTEGRETIVGEGWFLGRTLGTSDACTLVTPTPAVQPPASLSVNLHESPAWRGWLEEGRAEEYVVSGLEPGRRVSVAMTAAMRMGMPGTDESADVKRYDMAVVALRLNGVQSGDYRSGATEGEGRGSVGVSFSLSGTTTADCKGQVKIGVFYRDGNAQYGGSNGKAHENGQPVLPLGPFSLTVTAN